MIPTPWVPVCWSRMCHICRLHTDKDIWIYNIDIISRLGGNNYGITKKRKTEILDKLLKDSETINLENTVFEKYNVEISKEQKEKLHFTKDGVLDLNSRFRRSQRDVNQR